MNPTVEMVYSAGAVATIITSHGGYLDTVEFVDDRLGLEVMLNVGIGEDFEAMKVLYFSQKAGHRITLKTAKDAIDAVKSYMGK